jgi:hypothetical protein
MPDLMTRLAALRNGAPGGVDDDAVASDLRRGHAALITRRRRRAGAASAATLGIVAVGSLSYALGGSHDSRVPQAAGPHMAAASPLPSKHASAAAKQPTAATGPAIELAAYRGRQLPGYTVREVPKGYVLQGVSASVLDISEQGDHSPLDTFVGKMVVMLNDHPGPADGEAVSVSGHPGHIDDQEGVLALTWSDGAHNVEVQAWSNVHISRDQLVKFAEGITVLPNAQEGHG